MRCNYSCGSDEHVIARRQFLGGMAGGVVGGLGVMAGVPAAKQLEKTQQRVVCIYMSGGLSQLESWDPKPKTDTGGPFRAIPTSVPGIHLSELLPHTAKHMDKLALVRGINTKNGDHGKGSYHMQHGRQQMPGVSLPTLGAVCSKALEDPSNPMPGHIRIGGGGRGNDAAYLGPRYASIGADGKPPANSERPKGLSEAADSLRNRLRRKANDRFSLRRRTTETDAYTYSYERALQLMERRDVFDVSKEPGAMHELYGKESFGQHCLTARRLLEAGSTFVKLSHSNYDTHNENFNFHLEQVGEFDKGFGALIGDLDDRGMLDSTMIVVMSEFGRTPKINKYYGRDHWGTAWSICLGGGRIARGALVGKTNANGTKVIDREVSFAHLFHTYLAGVGLDSHEPFDVGGRPVPMADPAFGPIDELIV
ncbi:MAG: DUF1501 domain-containing protein [Planctomycetaceae bacterium]